MTVDSAADFLARLRRGDPPVVARIENDRGVLDVRTVLDKDALLRMVIA